MATSYFGLTPNTESPETPSQTTYQARDRYARAGITGELRYPLATTEFNVPFMRFVFLDAYADTLSGSPTIFIQVPNLFNISDFSDYSRTEAIFGAETEFTNIAGAVFNENRFKQGFDAANFALTSAEAFQYALQKGITNLTGFIASAGLSGISQSEFSSRAAVNPFTQLLYKGPQYRKYQIPLNIKPKNQAETKNVMKIITAFRLASSPSVPSTSGINVGEKVIGAGTSFLFGYPHLTEFQINFRLDDDTRRVLFVSKPCVMESVTVDYGGQKMTFFEDGMPTEINMTLQLTEIVPRTLGDSIADAKDDPVLGTRTLR